MKKNIALFFSFIFIFVLSACGDASDGLKKLDGKWKIDVAKTMKLSGMDSEDKIQRGLAEKIFGLASLEIDAKNKTLNLKRGNKSDTANVTLVSELGNVVTLKNEDAELLMTFDFQDNDTFVLGDAEGKEKVFVMARIK